MDLNKKSFITGCLLAVAAIALPFTVSNDVARDSALTVESSKLCASGECSLDCCEPAPYELCEFCNEDWAEFDCDEEDKPADPIDG